MTHQPLALKYRPATFADVVAQDHVTRTLRNALDRGRIAQAYLFAGPRGTGKTTTARLLAKALNCETGISGEPCDACENCRAIAAGRSLDVIEIDAASNRGIDDIKELRETVKYAAAQGLWKVYIVDEVHQLSKDAFNAFLKTLEEPPKSVVFVLATTEPHKILPTILSRCQRFDFRPIPLPAIRERIRRIAEAEGFEIEEPAEHAIAKKADGGLRDALSLLDQVVAFGGDAIDVATLRRLIGMPDEERYLQLTSILADGDAAGALALAREVRASGYDLEEFYTGFLEHLRDCLLFAIGDGAGTSEVPERYHETYRKLAGELGAEDLLRMLSLATDEERAFRRSSQQGLVLEVLLVRLALLDRTVELDRALAALGKVSGAAGAAGPAKAPDGAGRKGVSIPAEAARPTPRAASSRPTSRPEGPLTLERLSGAWESVVDAVHRVRPTVAAALLGARPVGCSVERIVLALPADAEFRMEQLRGKGTLQPLCGVLESRWGWSGRIEVETAEEAAEERNPRPARGPSAREAAERDVDARLKGDPLLQQVVELFDANVVRLRRPTTHS
ncbi:MAG: DNA polymerase III subunit gamma/tau [Gemmatimonadetes bacterium]|nr:DNA polymerase III subunit gamma/tau [Gemmatimonadota bacterium]